MNESYYITYSDGFSGRDEKTPRLEWTYAAVHRPDWEYTCEHARAAHELYAYDQAHQGSGYRKLCCLVCARKIGLIW